MNNVYAQGCFQQDYYSNYEEYFPDDYFWNCFPSSFPVPTVFWPDEWDSIEEKLLTGNWSCRFTIKINIYPSTKIEFSQLYEEGGSQLIDILTPKPQAPAYEVAADGTMSLALRYPNAGDRILGDPEQPGSDIFIHSGFRNALNHQK
ncbi:MAG: hypothetical protein J5I94_25290 [Phaeodactylibacter sp.]|nr:hypothetical protein [Phaeodactylibacter sp.]